jgi:NDP-sugar pyrophosphorylase family protein
MKIEKAVVLAAGRGTRMRELTADLPKPMIEVRGKPVLQHIVEGLRDSGIRKFLIVVGYRADAVQNFFGDGSRYNIEIQYATQIVQDGTGRVVDLARRRRKQRWCGFFERSNGACRSSGKIAADWANEPMV